MSRCMQQLLKAVRALDRVLVERGDEDGRRAHSAPIIAPPLQARCTKAATPSLGRDSYGWFPPRSLIYDAAKRSRAFHDD